MQYRPTRSKRKRVHPSEIFREYTRSRFLKLRGDRIIHALIAEKADCKLNLSDADSTRR